MKIESQPDIVTIRDTELVNLICAHVVAKTGRDPRSTSLRFEETPQRLYDQYPRYQCTVQLNPEIK